MNTQEIQNLIRELIERTSVKLNNIEVTEESPTNTWFAVQVDEPHFFIGKDAEALHALNHLVRRIIETRTPILAGANGPANNVLIDINGYQKKRIDDVRAMAHMMSERARYFKSNIEVNPMTAFERRIVHEFLADAQDLKTESIGVGPSRRVVIKYIGSL
jgi:predicted RNA-binding protein Jag